FMRSGFIRLLTWLPSETSGWRAVFGNSLWLLIEKMARWTIGLMVGVWTARYLGPADFGALNSALAWIALFGAAAGLGIEPIVLRELVCQPTKQATIMVTALVLRLVGATIAATLAISTV